MTTAVRLGLRVNAGQFALLIALNALVGGMVGLERSVLPLSARTTSGCARRARSSPSSSPSAPPRR
jgi:hypothetical protein